MVERVGLSRCVDVGPVEHVSRAVAVMQRATEGHHVLPTLNDTAATKCRQTEEEHCESTDNKNRCLDGRHGHHALHTAKDGEDCCDGDKAEGAPPEGQADEILKEDTTREGCHRDLGQDVSYECDDREPRTCALGVAELQEVGHRDDLAHLVVKKLIERHEQPAEDEDHPTLHLPVGHTHTVLCTGTGETHEVLRADVGGKDSHTDYIPGLALAEQIVLRVGTLHFLLVFLDGAVYRPYDG